MNCGYFGFGMLVILEGFDKSCQLDSGTGTMRLVSFEKFCSRPRFFYGETNVGIRRGHISPHYGSSKT